MARIELSPFMGLDEYTFPTLMKEGFSPFAINVDMDGGILKTAKGTKVFKHTPFAEYYLPYFQSNGDRQDLFIAGDGIYKINDDGFEWILEENYSNVPGIDFINYQQNDLNILIICCGATPPIVYSDKGLDLLSEDAPECKSVELHHERVFMSGDKDNPDRVYYSKSFAPDVWSAAEQAGFIDIPTWNGGKIQDIKSLFGDLVVFKDYDIFRIYGTYPGEFGVDQIHSSVGCAAKESIAATSDACYFISQNGLCVFNGVSAKPISDPRIEAIFKQVDFSRISEAKCIVHNSVLYMSLPMENDIVVEYNLQNGMILKKEGLGVKRFFVKDGQLMFVEKNNGYLCFYNQSYKIFEQPIKSVWRSKTYDLRDKSLVKSMEAVYMLGKGSGEIKITINCDGKIFEKTVCLTEKMRYYRVPIHGRGRQFFIQVENIDGSSFELDAPAIIIDCEVD